MKRLREDLHRCRFLLPCALAAVLLMRWVVMLGRPERLMELPLGALNQWVGVTHGKMVTFGVGPNGSDLIAHTRAVDTGNQRLLVRHPSADSDIGAFIAEPYLYFVNVCYRSGGLAGEKVESRSGLHSPKFSLTTPLATTPLKQTENNRPSVLGILSFGSRSRYADRIRTTLHRIPLAGGMQEEVRLDTTKKPPVFTNLAVARDRIFWTRRRPLTHGEAVGLTRKPNQPNQPNQTNAAPFPSAYYELMTTPGSGGQAVRLYGGIYQIARLIPSTDGVFWRVVRLDPGAPSDLVCVSASPLKVSVHKDVLVDPASILVSHRGRIYWIDEPSGSGSGLGGTDFASRRDLVSANPDGTDMRVVLSLSTNAAATYRLTRLYAYDGRMYGTLWEEGPTGTRGVNYRHYLCEIDPQREPIIKKLTSLPRRLAERGVFDQGYYYFIVNEQQENLFDWYEEEGARPDRFFLYRWKLPKQGAS